MKKFFIYEHICELPDFINSVNEELTECIMGCCITEEEVEQQVNLLNQLKLADKFGREKKLYIHWID